jgi:hypothetical protein
MNRIWALVALAMIVAATLGCSQKNSSSEAIAAAEQSLADVHELAMKYVPDHYAEVKADLEKARKAFEEQKYDEALAAVKTVPARAKQLGEEAAAAKEAALARLGEDWKALDASIPGRLADLENRLGELERSRQLPAGIEQDTVSKARSGLEWANKEWSEATASFAAGKVEEAVSAAQTVEYLLVTRMRALGMNPTDPVAPPK